MMVCACQSLRAHIDFGERPKLVVGIVVDQMRWDYLSRYYDQFGDDGFKRLIKKGYSCDNCLINYLPYERLYRFYTSNARHLWQRLLYWRFGCLLLW